MLAVAALVIAYLYLHLRNLQAVRPRGIDRRSEKDERTRVRIHITSVWANVLALLLISVVGFALLGLEIWRLNSAEKSYLSAPALEELLRTRLIDPKVQAQQHKEVVDAIREARPPGPTSIPDDGTIREKLSDLQAQVNRHEQILLREKPLTGKTAIETAPAVSSFFFLIGAFILSGILLIAAAVWLGFYFLYNKNVISKKAYDIAKVGVVTLGSLASGVTLFKDFSLNPDSLIKFNIQGPAPTAAAQPTQLNLHVYHRLLRHSVRQSGPIESDCGNGDAQRVGPFRDGRHLLEVAGQEKLKQVVASLVERSQSERLISVTLGGSVDKRELSRETAAIYGSDAGLARARSQVVSDELVRALAPETVQIMHSFSGPVNFGAKVSADGLASDRSVQVCVYWRPKT